MRRLSIISILFFLTIPIHLSGQKVTYDVEHFSVDAGLPDHWVLSLLEHSSGFLLLGTTHGLSRFDGYTFATIVPEGVNADAFSGSIRGMKEIAGGDVLVSMGLPSLRVGDIIYMKYDLVTNAAIELSSADYQSILENEKLPSRDQKGAKRKREVKGGVLILTHQDIYGNTLITKSEGSTPIWAELRLASGERLDLSESWKTLPKPATSVSKNFGDVIYWGGYNGLLKISIRRSPFDLILNEEAEDWEYRTVCRAMIEVNKDSILISTEGTGEAVYDKSTHTSSFIHWNGVDNGSLGSGNHFRNFTAYGNEGEIYGVNWALLYSMNVKRNTLIAHITSGYKSLSSSLLGDSKYLVARRKPTVYKYFLEVLNLEDKTIDSFSLVNGQEVFEDARPTYIFPKSDSTVWYCTKSGLFLLDIKHREIKHLYLDRDAEKKSYDFPVSYSLSGPHVWVIHDSGDGLAWIGLDGDGLNVLEYESGDVTYYTTVDGLPNNTVVGILPDSTGYWMSTFKGLCHFDTARTQFRNFYKSNGIAHDEFNRFSFLTDRDGKYYFGSMNGVTSFYPEDVLGKSTDLKLLITEIAHYNKSGDEQIETGTFGSKQNSIIIPSNNRLLSIKMCLNDFNNPAGNTFFYHLVNTNLMAGADDQNWTALGVNHELRFENFEAGRYQLYLKGISATGVTSDEVVIAIMVNEFFYKTWWFILACVMLVFSVLYSWHVLRLRQALRIEKLRTKLSSDLHDDVGGLLSGIALQMDALEYTVGEKHEGLVRRIAETSRTAMEKMRDVVWAMDARQGTVQDLKIRMLESAEEVLGPLEIVYEIHTDVVAGNLVIRSEVRHNLLLIFKEFINNLVKHADASKVEVYFYKKGRLLEMDIADNGVGFDVASAHGSGQGLSNMVMRAERMNGEIKFLNKNGFGVNIKVPLR